MLDKDEIDKIERMVKAFLLHYRMGHLAEDVKQEVYARILKRHKNGLYNIKWLVIDILRESFGRKGNRPCKTDKSILTRNAKPIDKVSENIFKELQYESIQQLDIDKITKDLSGISRAIVMLRYKWGLDYKEIGDCFGKTESWACHNMRLLHQEIRTRYFLK